MKKIITLLFCVGIISCSFAQSSHHQQNDQQVAKNSYKNFGDHRNSIYTFSAKEKDMQISKINNDFGLKVKSIKHNHHLKKDVKKEMIQKASIEKYRQIQAVNDKFNSKFNTASTAYNFHKKFGKQ